ncbi:MAG: DegV family protein [Actinomycetota bacterium]|nr:DegV family protein [Actinomycetota bacterium]
MTSRIKIVTDSSCDLPIALAAENDIAVIPLAIRFGDEELFDRRDLTPKEFWERCASSPVLPETAAPSPGSFEQVFRAAQNDGYDGVVCINLSSKLSATRDSALTGAKAMEGGIPVNVVDSLSVTMGLGMIVLEAAEAASEGKDLEEVTAVAIDAARRTRVYGTLDTLENLKKGGRIGKAQSLIGSLLSIKPIIEVKDGAVEPGPKQRTRARAFAWLAEQVTARPSVDKVAVIHGEAPDVDKLIDMLAPQVPRDRVIVADLGAVIGTHAGPRCVGVAFQVKA